MPRRALITGASGFAGRYLLEHLLAAGDEILACGRTLPNAPPNPRRDREGASNLSRDREGAPNPSRDREGAKVADGADSPLPHGRGSERGGSETTVHWIQWDLTDPGGLDPVARSRVERFKPEVIYHLAAMSVSADCGKTEPTPEAVAVNVEGTRRVIDFAASLAPPPRVLLASSSRVYAPVAAASPVVNEDSPVGPVGGYGKTKLAAERIVLDAWQRQGLHVVVARAFQHTGPRQSPQMMLSQWASQFAAATRSPVQVHTLDAYVDLSDVRDVVRAYRLLVERGEPGRIYNVGSGVNRRSGDLFELLRAMVDPDRPAVQRRPGRKQDPIADVSRLVQCTGWRPEIPIEQTIADTWTYWRRIATESEPRP